MSTHDETSEFEIRPPRETENYKLPVPGDAGPADYVTDTGNLADAVDALAAMFFPGDFRLTASRRDRPGWLICDGREIRRDLYVPLFDEIGEDWGPGDGELTFNIPDLRSRTLIAAGQGAGLTARILGQLLGVEAHAISVAEMAHHAHGVADPSHAHSIADPGHAHTLAHGGQIWGDAHRPFAFSGQDIPIGGTWVAPAGTSIGIHAAFSGIGIYGEGGGGAHPNMQPSAVVNVFIKT